MVAAVQAARAGAAAAARLKKKTVTYAAFTTLPVGVVDLAFTPGAGVGQISGGNRLTEGNSVLTTSAYFSAVGMPDLMATDLVSVTVTNAAASSTTRGMGAAIMDAAGTKAVYCILSGNTTAARLSTFVGGADTAQSTQSGLFSVSGTDTIELRPTVNAGVVTWTVYKNGVATALTWTDSGHVIDLPGKRPAAAFRHEVSGGTQFPSPGVKALTAVDL